MCLALAFDYAELAHSTVLFTTSFSHHALDIRGKLSTSTCAAAAQVDVGDNDAAVPPAVPEEAPQEIPKLTCRTSNERK